MELMRKMCTTKKTADQIYEVATRKMAWFMGVDPNMMTLQRPLE